jgi:hypothetical protein
MAKRKKRAKVLRRKSATLRSKSRKGSKPARGKAKKRTIARAKPKRSAAKMKPPSPAVETVAVDVVEEPAPGVITVTEFEETQVTRPGREDTEC